MATPGFDPVAFHARFRPDHLACADLATGERLSFATFSERATATAHRIVRLAGRKRGERIVIVSRNSALVAIIAIACERAGAIFVPLNWRLTAQELSTLLAD
ncbi:MAG TPA: AMP-binding protein, partial [Chthoniobacteraceae bacterium]|nr:AMP-binding protein [Chthoniobacteraceae bacterium]